MRKDATGINERLSGLPRLCERLLDPVITAGCSQAVVTACWREVGGWHDERHRLLRVSEAVYWQAREDTPEAP